MSRTLPEIERADEWIKEANLAAEHARQVREVHRRATRRGNKQREQDIDLALTRLKKAMAPIRSIIARLPYLDGSNLSYIQEARLQEASALLQSERRKLWKMAHPKTRKRRARRRA